MDITSYLLGKNSAGGSGGSDLDWSALGYSGTPEPTLNAYNLALEIQRSWTPSTNLRNRFKQNYDLFFMPLVDTSIATDMSSMFHSCFNIQKVPLLNTSNCTTTSFMFQGCELLVEVPLFDLSKNDNVSYMFYDCTRLKDVPQFDLSSMITRNNMASMFSGCRALSDESLNNILGMCISASSYTGAKTLAHIGISSTYYPVERIQALSNYQDFIDAGWTIGYE